MVVSSSVGRAGRVVVVVVWGGSRYCWDDMAGCAWVVGLGKRVEEVGERVPLSEGYCYCKSVACLRPLMTMVCLHECSTRVHALHIQCIMHK